MLKSIVITTFNDPLRLQMTLAGWCGQLDKNCELIVVDDGGDFHEETMGLVLNCEPYFKNVAYIYLSPSKAALGKQVFRLAAARNSGLKRAKGELTIISDCDTVPSPDVAAIFEQGYAPNRVQIGIRKRIAKQRVAELKHNTSFFKDLESLAYQTDERLLGPRAHPRHFLNMDDVSWGWDLCWGCLFAAPTKHFKALGGFDQRFESWGGEDEDMAERLVRGAGCVLTAKPNAVVYHLDHEPRCTAPYQGQKNLAEIRANWRPVVNNGPIT
jgi:cellulose synthase/poly-beta-1,6-N-acetylglucosamine synthase-like glycosyltransferase